MKVRAESLKFWQTGAPNVEWLTVTPEDMMVVLPNNREPLPAGGVQKRPNLIRSGTA